MDNTGSIAKTITSKLSKFMKKFKTKEDVDKTVIKCTSMRQGGLIIKFYEELGIANKYYLDGCTVGSYYGAINGVLRVFDKAVPSGFSRIRPRLVPKYVPKLKFPRTMWVSNGGTIWTKAVVIARINKFERKYIASIDTPDRIDARYYGFKYAKEIKSNHN